MKSPRISPETLLVLEGFMARPTDCLVGAAATEAIGVHAIFGAFLVGIALSRFTKPLSLPFSHEFRPPAHFLDWPRNRCRHHRLDGDSRRLDG